MTISEVIHEVITWWAKVRNSAPLFVALRDAYIPCDKWAKQLLEGQVWHAVGVPRARSIDRYIPRVRGEAEVTVFTSPPSQGSASCRNWHVAETVMGGATCDSVHFSSRLVGKMVGLWFTELFCWKRHKSRQDRGGDSWKRKIWRTEKEPAVRGV